jgi:D-alanyl-D-alanine-carboxypeptidase/D-alanyl-D-alanine-endopeptidase
MLSRASFLSAIGLILLRTATFAQIPPDTEIRQILADRVGAENLGIGIVAGVIDSKGRRVVAYGSLAKDDKRPLNGDTIFEIGSMTKVFTSLVLMDMAQKGEVALTDPVSKYLPPGVKMPERNNRQITLQDLSTQSSGLPRLPSNLAPKDPLNPYADYSVEQLYQFLSGYQLTRDIGAKYE